MAKREKQDSIVPHNFIPESEADRLSRAAQMAFEDGDMDHWRRLNDRATAARRRARERAAGVPDPWANVRE